MTEELPDSLRLAFAAIDARGPLPIPHAEGVGARKMLGIIVLEESDARIDRGGLRVRWPRRRKPSSYFPSLAPHLISLLRAGAPGGEIGEPFALTGGSLRILPLTQGVEERWIWVSRTSDAILIECRVPIGGTRQPISASNLPFWEPAPRRMATFPEGRSCTACGVTSARFRLLKEALICLKCGCSERSEAGMLAAAVVDAVGESAAGRTR